MQGSNTSRIGMKNSHQEFDDSNWGYGKKNTRGNKAKGSKAQAHQSDRKNKQKNQNDYNHQE